MNGECAKISELLKIPEDTIQHVRGRFSNVYICGNQIVVKTHPKSTTSLARIEFINQVKDHYSSEKILIPKQFILEVGTSIIDCGDVWMVFENYVEGEQIYKGKSASEGFEKIEHVVHSAKSLTQLHLEMSRINIVNDHINDEIIFQKFALKMISDNFYFGFAELTKYYEFVELIRIIERKSALYFDKAKESMAFYRKGLIHNDYIPRNATYGKNGTVKGVLDFDFCNYNYYICDLAWTIDWIGYPRKLLSNSSFYPRFVDMNLFVNTYLDNSDFITKIDCDLLTYLIPLIRIRYDLSIANYLAKTSSFENATKELEWVIGFLDYYDRNLFIFNR